MRLLSLPAAAGLVCALVAAAPLTASADADGCDPSTVVDFNGDGRTDAAVGDDSADVGSFVEAGRVVVRYGGADGHVGSGGSAILTQAGAGGTNQTGANFGISLAAADADCDGYTDLLVGADGFDLPGATNAGVAHLVRGSAGGLGAAGDTTTYTAASFGRAPQGGDVFGRSVDMVEDVGTGGTPSPDAYALAIGVPGRDSDGKADSGAVATRSAVDGGNTGLWIDQESSGVSGASEPGDGFGESVALLYDGDGRTDLIVGSPREDLVVGSKNVVDAGVITRIRNLYGDEYTSGTSISQNSSGVPGSVEARDAFGEVLAASRSGSTNFLAVGSPQEDVGSRADAGQVQLFTLKGSTLTPKQAITQDTSGVKDTANTADGFGASVSLALAGSTYLAVGVPGENEHGTNSGVVQVFKASSPSTDYLYTPNTSGVAGSAAAGQAFGSQVALVEGATEDVLLATSRNLDLSPNGVVHVVAYRGGSALPNAFWAGSSGSVRFGSAIASQGN